MRLTIFLLGLLLFQTSCVSHQNEGFEKVETVEERETELDQKMSEELPENSELQDKIEDLSESISELAQSLTQVVAAKAKESSEYVDENKDDVKQQLHQLSLKMDTLAQQAANSSHEGLKTLLSRMEDAVDDLNRSLQKEAGN